jgi:hypothetical protein
MMCTPRHHFLRPLQCHLEVIISTLTTPVFATALSIRRQAFPDTTPEDRFGDTHMIIYLVFSNPWATLA